MRNQKKMAGLLVLVALCHSNLVMAEDNKSEDDWRFIISPFSGQMNLQLRSALSFNYTDPTTGASVSPAIGRITGLTQSGTLDLAVEGVGPQKGVQMMLRSDSLVISAAYTRAEVNFTPLRDSKLPIENAGGGANGNVYTGSIEYYWNITDSIAPMVGYSHSGFTAHYKVTNALFKTIGTNVYESFAVIDADDGSHSNVGKLGIRIKLPIQSWSITPYVQYAANRYHINTRPTIGRSIGQENLIPTDANAIVQAWTYDGVGSAINAGSMSQIPAEDRSGGLILFMDYNKFLSLNINARRNWNKGAWNVTTTALFFFHPNVGIQTSYLYAEPEVTLTFNRSWIIGPVFTATF